MTGGSLEWNPNAIGPLVSFASAAVMAALIWAKGRPGRATFAPLSLVAGLWSLGVGVAMCLATPEPGMLISRLVITVVVASGPLAVNFATDFARIPRRGRWVALAAASASVAVALVWLDPEVVSGIRRPPWGGYYPLGGSRFWIIVAIVVAGIIGAATAAILVFVRTPPSRRRRQAAYIVWSYVAAMMGGIDASALYGFDLPPMAWATTLVSVALVYYAIVRWRLMDIRTALHRTLFWGLALSATFLPLYWLAQATAGWEGWDALAPRLVAAVVALAVLRAYAALAERGLALWFDRARRRHPEVLGRFDARALEARRPGDLVDPLDQALRTAGLEFVLARFIVDPGSGRPRDHAVGAGGAARDPGPALDVSALPDEPLAREELDPEDAGQRSLAAFLDASGGDVLVPLREHGKAVGAIVARRRRALREDARELASRLAARAAVAFTNATLYDALERRSAGLEVEVEERTQALATTIAELKAAQASLVQAEKQSALGLLVAGVSHEINNALNFIYGNLPTLGKYLRTYDELAARAQAAGVAAGPELAERARAARAEIDRDIETIGDAARRARQIVDDLRRFARPDEAERRPADIREGLDSTVNLLAPELRGRRIEVERRYQAVPPVDCFPAALNHVFLNVLLNAAQAMSQGGTITIEVAERDGLVVVAVSDTGPGVAPADRARVFEPFFTTKRRAAGLGLTVSRQIAERHHGTITIDDNPAGKGACVTISLPPASPAEAAA